MRTRLISASFWWRQAIRISNIKSIIDTILPLKNTTKKWSVLIGPEGGFSHTEQDLILKNNGAISVSLGNTILRSDTAITVALYCIKEITS